MDVLVVEDAGEYAQLVSAVLTGAGHRVRSAGSIREAERSLVSLEPDLVVLDLTLPDGDGLDLCRTIRERTNAYIVMLTGRDEEVDKLLGFRLGADDYVTKPFSPREFVARVDALSRRPREARADVVERTFGDVVLRPLAREVEVAGSPVELTRIEFDLLDHLSANPHQILTRAQLIELVWGSDWYGGDHVLDVHMANLRKKLAAQTDAAVVRTVRGVGYGLAS